MRVNLSPASIPLGESGSRILEPNSAMEAADGEYFHLGEFTLTFHLQDGSKVNSPMETAAVETIAAHDQWIPTDIHRLAGFSAPIGDCARKYR